MGLTIAVEAHKTQITQKISQITKDHKSCTRCGRDNHATSDCWANKGSRDINGNIVESVDMNGWGTVRWYESLIMICVYVGYVLLCWKFSGLAGWLCPTKDSGTDADLDAWISTINQAPGTPEAAVAAAAIAGGMGAGACKWEGKRFEEGRRASSADSQHGAS